MNGNNINNEDFDKDFERDLENAFVFNERKTLKTLFENIESTEDLNENELEVAFIKEERQRLRNQFKKLDAEEEELDQRRISVSASNPEKINRRIHKGELKFYWKKIAVAATVVGLIVLTSIWVFINNRSTPDKDFANSENNQIDPIKNIDSIKNIQEQQKNKENFAFINELENKKYTDTTSLDIRNDKTFGFSSNKKKAVKFINYNLDKQILNLKYYFEDYKKVDTNNNITVYLKSKMDSILELKNHYTFDIITLSTYNINSKDIDVYFLSDKYYLRVDTFYFELIKTNTPIILKKLNDQNIIDNLEGL